MSDDIYRIKNVVFKEKTVPILMQNMNGPCPLLAISEEPSHGILFSREASVALHWTSLESFPATAATIHGFPP